MKKKIKFLIGSDPEFFIDCYNANLISEYDIFGKDGSGEQFEIRPKPAYTPSKIIQNIKEALQIGYSLKALQNEKWMAATCYDGISYGGHIHLGTKGLITNKLLQKYLNIYVGTLFSLLCKEEEIESRQSCGYGKFDDIRRTSYGLEWRVLSGIWLANPKIAKATFALIKLVTYEAIFKKHV